MYIVSEEELKELIDRFRPLDSYNQDAPKYSYISLKNFLKSKKPVELIAEGEVSEICNYPECDLVTVGGDVQIVDYILSNKYFGKSVKLYVEIIKDKVGSNE